MKDSTSLDYIRFVIGANFNGKLLQYSVGNIQLFYPLLLFGLKRNDSRNVRNLQKAFSLVCISLKQLALMNFLCPM